MALYLYLLDQGIKFEAVFCDTGCEWPETYEYIKMFKAQYPLTIIKPNAQGFDSLYDYCYAKKLIPSRQFKWCTDKFKQVPQNKYFKQPCFLHIGIDAGEPGRAKIVGGEIEQRYRLVEDGIDRNGCKDIIMAHGLPIPRKSACYICYNMKRAEWIELRRTYPELFCNAETLEERANEARKARGKGPIYFGRGPLKSIVNKNQAVLFEEMEYPPCQCGL